MKVARIKTLTLLIVCLLARIAPQLVFIKILHGWKIKDNSTAARSPEEKIEAIVSVDSTTGLIKLESMVEAACKTNVILIYE